MAADVVSIVRKFVSFHLMKHYYVMRQFDEVTSVVLDFLQFLRKDTSLPADMSAQLDTAIEVRPMPARPSGAGQTVQHVVSTAAVPLTLLPWYCLVSRKLFLEQQQHGADKQRSTPKAALQQLCSGL